MTQRYSVDDFHRELLQSHIQHDMGVLQDILQLIQPITPTQDAKLQTLKAHHQKMEVRTWLVFTQYSDTARDLFDTVNPGGQREDITCRKTIRLSCLVSDQNEGRVDSQPGFCLDAWRAIGQNKRNVPHAK